MAPFSMDAKYDVGGPNEFLPNTTYVIHVNTAHNRFEISFLLIWRIRYQCSHVHIIQDRRASFLNLT